MFMLCYCRPVDMAQSITNRTAYWPDDELQQLRIPMKLMAYVPSRLVGTDNPALMEEDQAANTQPVIMNETPRQEMIFNSVNVWIYVWPAVKYLHLLSVINASRNNVCMMVKQLWWQHTRIGFCGTATAVVWLGLYFGDQHLTRKTIPVSLCDI